MSVALNPATLLDGIKSGNRVMLGRAITLVESKHPDHQKIAADLIEKVLPLSGKSIRLGITGVPGVGKSTFIESFGDLLVKKGKKLAVLSIDPSSTISKGSILGDKTRMESLARNPAAFIRPSATGNYLGGVAQHTRETILLCEAAGYDVIIVETVGVGQSETEVRDMVDFFLLLMLAGGGDELQGIKRGIMEMADMIVVNKADGGNEKACKSAVKEYQRALHLFPPPASGWTVPVLAASGLAAEGLKEIWNKIIEYQDVVGSTGYLQKIRGEQNTTWFHHALRQYLEARFYENPTIKSSLKGTMEDISKGKISVRQGISKLIQKSNKN